MENNNSNILIKTIIFILAVALSSVLFFGLGDTSKTEMELIAFGFLMFAELVTYITILIPSIKRMKKVTESDLSSVGILYLITSIITNCISFSSIDTIKLLIIINVVEIIVFMMVFCMILLRKNNN